MNSNESLTIQLKTIISNLTPILIEIKEKRVSTVEGERFYHLPIGAPIVKRPRAHLPKVRQIEGVTSENAKIDATSLNELNKTIATIKKGNKKDEVIKAVRRKKAKAKYDIPDFTIVANMKEFSGSDPKLGREISFVRNSGKGGWTWKVKDGKKTTPLRELYNMERKDMHLRVIRFLKEPYIQDAYENSKNTNPLHTQFMDKFLGIHKLDWIAPHEDDEDVNPVKDTDARIETVKQDQDDLGIAVRTMDENVHINLESQEILNESVRVMDNLFPEFSAYQPYYAIDINMPSGHIAENYSINKSTRPMLEDAVKDNPDSDYHLLLDGDMDWDYHAIQLNPEFFSNQYDSKKLMRLATAEGEKFFSVEDKNFPKSETLSETDKVLLTTLIHETGHTVHAIATGYLESEKQQKFSLEGNKFMDDLYSVLEKWGVITPNDNAPYLNYADHNSTAGRLRTISLDAKYLEPLLSRYGARNLNEFMAECWTEYMLGDSPRPLATEVGRLMEARLKEFMKIEKHPSREDE